MNRDALLNEVGGGPITLPPVMSLRGNTLKAKGKRGMRLSRPKAALLVLGCSLCALGAAREEAKVVQELREAQTEAATDQVVANFNQSRVDLINDLVTLLREAPSAEKKGRVCFLLGEVDNGRSIRPLIENLLVKVSAAEEDTRIPLWRTYPCQEALARMGKPAEFQLIEILSGSESEQMKAGALNVFREIEGWPGTVFVLEQAMGRAGLEQREQLGKALEKAKKEVSRREASATEK
jgi:hypothetical protein